jgi:2-polyprenyl-3-methyl-5-hydroxy-6-metoxy-1,4-benzoquinol methylase
VLSEQFSIRAYIETYKVSFLMDNKDIGAFYDDMVPGYKNAGINERVYALYQRMLQHGLQRGSRVLELGCFTGSLTYLLSRSITSGQVEAVDLSEGLIRFCKEQIRNKKIKFFVADIVAHVPSLTQIDFITLFDVIEHIPMQRHDELFKNISNWCNDDTKVLINIPNPDYIQYAMEHNASSLQVIDQALPLQFILENLERNGLCIMKFETYSIWVENDYQFFVVSKKRTFMEKKLSDKRSIFQKAVKKLGRYWVSMRYRY